MLALAQERKFFRPASGQCGDVHVEDMSDSCPRGQVVLRTTGPVSSHGASIRGLLRT